MTDTMKIDVTKEDIGILAIIAMNKAEKKDRIERWLRIGRLTIRYERRKKKEAWGRFGGGWNWRLGFSAGGKTIIVDLLVSSLRFSIDKK